MQSALLPFNEAERLKVLKSYNILDTPPEKAFDDITALAVEILEMPICLVSLIDTERQWFKSKVGLDTPSTHRDFAFCAHAILQPEEITEVKDATQDERFVNNPLVLNEPKIRFYAGAPIIDKAGYVLGTLCVIDQKPNQLNDQQKSILKKLAHQVSKLIELNKSTKNYNYLTQSTNDLIYELDDKGVFLFANEACINALGYTFEELQQLTFWDLIDASERQECQEIYKTQIKQQEASSYHEVSIRKKNGEIMHIGQTVDFEFTGEIMSRAFVVSKDITELKNTQEELNKREEIFLLLSEGSSDMICLNDFDGKYRFVSESVRNLLGYEPDELIGRDSYEFIAPDQHEPLRNNEFKIVLSGQIVPRFEYKMRHKEGYYIWMESYARPIKNEDGSIKYIQTSSRDISRRKQKEEEVIQANKELERYRKGLHALNVIPLESRHGFKSKLKEGLKTCRDFLGFQIGYITTFDLPNDCFNIMEYDAEFESDKLDISISYPLENTLTKLSFDQAAPLAIHDIYESSCQSLSEFKNLSFQSHVGTHYEVDGKKRGTINFFSKERRSIPFTTYELEFINLMVRWIGQVIYLEESRKHLLAEQHILRAFVLSAPAAIAMFDKEVRYIAASEKWYKDYNITQNIISKIHYDVFPEIGEDWKSIYQRTLKGEVIRRDEDRFVRMDGTVQWLRWEARPWYTSNGKIGGIVMSSDDITAIKGQAEELKSAKEMAEESGKTKENFLSTMSHEIRTPLNAIIGTTKLLEMENPELAANEKFKLLRFSSNNLLSLINDVLDFNKLQSGSFHLENRPFDLGKLIENIVNTWKPSVLEKSLIIKFEKPDFPLGVNGDPIRIGQILNNLLSNAIKFTREGLIKISLEVDPLFTSKNQFNFEIKDTGIGIPQAELNQIFQSFHQISNEENEKTGGTGLGLAIVRKLVEMMGGYISVKSQEGLGTVFNFNLQLETAIVPAEIKPATPQEIMKKGLEILLVEDNLANQTIATGFLEKWGISTTIAQNGLESISKITEKKFDLILMDLRMPVMNGYVATEKIREMHGEYFQKIPIVALTASTMLDVKKKVVAVGMNDVIYKPFDPDELFHMISKYTSMNYEPDLNAMDGKKYKYLSRLFNDDQERIQEIVKISIESIVSNLTNLKLAIQNQDNSGISDALHSLRPNLAHLDQEKLAKKTPLTGDVDYIRKLNDWISSVEEVIETTKKELNL